MFINHKIASLVYKAILLVACGVGLYACLSGGVFLHTLSYYTVLSNILVFVFYFLSVILMLSDRSDLRCSVGGRIKGTVLMAITLTFLVFQFLLAPIYIAGNMNAFWALSNVFPHYIVPIMVILDWLLFDRKGKYKASDFLYFTIPPIAYLIFSFIRGAVGPAIYAGSYYPYPFMDIQLFGVTGVVVNIIVISAAYILLSLVFIAIDSLLGKIAHLRNERIRRSYQP